MPLKMQTGSQDNSVCLGDMFVYGMWVLIILILVLWLAVGI